MTTASSSRLIKQLDKLNEFEREPISQEHLQPGRYFAGTFAGEHVAGTEFVIGATFVAWGVRASDIFIGLLIGNALAVLTWTFVCSPIAVQTRLTLYWYLRKIAGPLMTMLYNLLNAVLFCILAGCMITVSASAVRIPFGIPAQTRWYPEDFRFVLVVLVVGAVVVTLAIWGFKKLAQFASISSPWMFLMFFAGAVAALPRLALATPGVADAKSIGNLWAIANNTIWVGGSGGAGQSIGFWHVAAFAWICNLAMHAGLSDMALLRYAKKVSYGAYSAFGMFLGHYLAWICAGCMGAAAALAAKVPLSELDAGGVAVQALGVTGAIAVVIAGWTTSNPTLYRAGLAFQAVTPNWPRWLVTLLAGIVTTIIACFPFVFTKLLEFVGYYGLLLMPIGAIVFTEHWVFPRIGFTRYWASHKKLTLSWPALLSWIIAIATALVLEQTGTLHLFFLFIPIWILTMVLYIAFAAAAGVRQTFPQDTPQQQLADSDNSRSQAQAGPAEERNPGSTGGAGSIVLWVAGGLAAIALLSCLFMPIWVWLGGIADYEARFGLFKTILIWPTILYLVSATIWVIQREKLRSS